MLILIYFNDYLTIIILVKPLVIFYITDRSKAVLLIWFSVFACFGVSFCTFSHYVFLDDI